MFTIDCEICNIDCYDEYIYVPLTDGSEIVICLDCDLDTDSVREYLSEREVRIACKRSDCNDARFSSLDGLCMFHGVNSCHTTD